MSVENLKEYARRCATEPELRAAARELGAADVDGHIRHAAGLGLDWSEDDMLAFRKEVLDAAGGVDTLTEEEMERVAGGAVTSTAIAVASVAAVVVVAAAGAAAGAGSAATSGSAW